MRWVLPGGAVLGASDREGDERAVACRPRAAVLESVRPPRPLTIRERLRAAMKLVSIEGIAATSAARRVFSMQNNPI